MRVCLQCLCLHSLQHFRHRPQLTGKDLKFDSMDKKQRKLSVQEMTKFKNDYDGITPVLDRIINCRNILTNVITNLHRQQTEATHFVVKGQNVINEGIINMTVAPLHVVCFMKTKMTLDTKSEIENRHVTFKEWFGANSYFGYFGRYFLPFYLVKLA